MPKIAYIEKNFRKKSLARIAQVNAIIERYDQMNLKLTLRQIFYQLVAADLIPNTDRQYDNLGSLVASARMAGLVDWEAIEDRTRYVRSLSSWTDASQIIRSAWRGFKVDRWQNQPYRPIVIVEKDAVANIVERACSPLDVSWTTSRGYGSASSIWNLAQRLS